ncbi:MAG: family 43 glycosylhydrolase [Kiritimatiellae bacterium]|nr:family 43 glycosylhydrolase [Kiritimatiellia bacterium]
MLPIATWAACAKERFDNPIFDGWYADPQIRRYGDTWWVFPTRSARFRDGVAFDAFSSSDMKTWTKHESILSTNEVKWARGAMWAPDAHEVGGRYYLFFSANDAYPVGGRREDGEPQKEPGLEKYGGIGVAVADRPEGPYRDLVGKPLIDRFWNSAQPIDQYVFEYKGEWYMVYGGWGRCNLVKLARDFKSLVPFEDGSMWRDMTPKDYVEGSVMFERKGRWYFMYSSGAWTRDSYRVNYSVADTPFGPFEFKGQVLGTQRPLATGAGHHSVACVPGTDEWYICYHRRPIPNKGHNHRVVCIDRMEFDVNGDIKPVVMTRAELPEREFRSPSTANRPETWFHFIGGNVAKPGITSDLEAIKGAGISGIHLFHGQFGGPWPGVSPQITCLSAPWDGLVGFVADECRRLDLSFAMQNCPGWAMSGGPWVKPENAMRHLIWKRIDVDGGRRVEVKLPTIAPSAPDPKDYRDILVLAFPATAGQWDGALKPSKVTGSVKGDWEEWQEKGKPVKIDGGTTATITFDFAGPVTIRTVQLPCVDKICFHRYCYDPETTVICEANGKTLFTREIPQANWQDDRPLTYACDETTTKQLKITLKPRHEISMGKIYLFSSARNDDWEAQAGWTLRSLMRNPPAKQSDAAWVKSAEVRDVTKFMKPDGTFAWDAPAGRWAIVRVGHVNTMRKNGPAPKEGTGFECDKLSTKGADVQFDNYIGRLSGEGGPVKGKMARMLMDSWECKRQTWTPGLDKVFRERLGYDLLRWMPAIFGYVVDDPETTARFLDDWRGFLGDLVTENFYAQMAKRCHERGIGITFETSFGDVIPGDILKYYKYADVPMCEFWSPRSRGHVGDHNFKPVYPCVSAAHLYGKKSVAAEALTSRQITWDEKLRDLKYVANLHIARGVSHMVFHTYTHNPRTDWLPPGTSFGSHIGTPFLRGQTWWKFMPNFTAYFARCQAMLEAGKPANDVLWYLGDEWDHKPNEETPFPAGYKFDYCNPDALLARISVNANGEWATPDGIAYRILWVPESKRMMPETMEKILDGVKKGGKAAFAALPESISTLRGGAAMQARFDKALAAMKASRNIYVGQSLESALAAEKIAKDLVAEGVVWNHRRSDDADWYFVSPAKQYTGFSGEIDFRASGSVEIWHPEAGEVESCAATASSPAHARVKLSLAPHEACFVVFRKDGTKTQGCIRAACSINAAQRIEDNAHCQTIAGPWQLAFPEGWGMPAAMQVAALKPWKELGATPEAKAFSGTATYEADFTLDALSGGTVTLDLGRVESLAQVEVNGVKLHDLWCEPYSMDITSAVRQGANTLKVSVTDTWFNRLVYDAGQPESNRKTWTIAGPKKDAPLRESGLLGPVKVMVRGVAEQR